MLNIQPNISGTNFLILKHNTFNGLIGPNYPNPECFFIMGNNSSTGAIPWGFYSGVCKYFASSTPINSLRYDIGSCLINNTLATLTGTNTFSPLLSILFNGNVGIGSSFPAYKLDVNGTTNSLNIFKNGIDIDNIFISSNILQIQNYINSNSIQDNLSFYISSNIIANVLTPYDTISARNTALGSYLTTASASSTYATITNLGLKENALTFSSPLTRTTNTIGIDLSLYDTISARNTALGSYLTTASASSTYATITNLGLKENALTFSSPLTRTTNTIGIDLSLYDTISARNTALGSYLTTASASSTYLPLSGGTMTSSLIMTGSSSAFYFGGGSGCALGEAGGAGAFSSSALTNDCILRSRATNQLILQSGGGAGALIISSANNTTIKNNLDVNGILNANYPDIRINGVNGVSLLTLEARIMGTNGYSACFSGDMYETSFWGKCVCINGGGLGDNVNAGATKIQYTSSFSIYTRSSGASTYFDKHLFVVRNSGNVGIGTTNPSQSLDVRGGIISQNLIIGDNTSYSSQYQLFFIPPTSTTSAQIQKIQQGVNYNQNLNLQPNGGTITLTGATNVGGILTVLKNNWIISSDNIARIYFQDNGTTYFHSGNTGTGGFNFRNFAQSDIFTINENGNVSSTGAINANGNSLVFPNTLSNFKISLWGPNIYGFGVQANELKYTSGVNHKFYTDATNTFTIDGSGNTSCIGNISGSTLSTPQIATSTYNNLLAKSIEIYPFSSVGGSYNNGYWLIDVQDYCNQAGFVYLFLNINAPTFLYWQGRVVIANSSSINFYNDMAYNVNLSLISSSGRLKIVVACPSGTNNGFKEMYVKIMG